MKHKNTMKQQYQGGRIHPLVATAAVAVTLVSLVGIAAITGVIPSSNSTTAPAVSMNGQAPMTGATSLDNRSQPYPAAPQVITQSPTYVAIPDPVPARVAPEPERAPARVVKPAPRPVANDNYSQSNQQRDYQERDYQVAKGPAVCNNCGRVESVVAVNQPAQGSGLGIAAGAVLGGVLGNQVGGGSGKTLATVAGAVAGGYGGNEVEKRARATTTYQVRVRMEDGDMRTFPQSGQNGWSVGDRVKVVNGALRSRG